MIKSDKGTVIVNGELTDVVFELHHLIREMAKKDPEIVSAVIFKNADGLRQAIKNSDKVMLLCVEDFIDYIEYIREENNDEE